MISLARKTILILGLVVAVSNLTACAQLEKKSDVSGQSAQSPNRARIPAAEGTSKIVTIEGKQAEQIMSAMDGSPNTKWLENTVGVTILQNGNVTCTLYGSHGGSPRFKNPAYSCEISL